MISVLFYSLSASLYRFFIYTYNLHFQLKPNIGCNVHFHHWWNTTGMCCFGTTNDRWVDLTVTKFWCRLHICCRTWTIKTFVFGGLPQLHFRCRSTSAVCRVVYAQSLHSPVKKTLQTLTSSRTTMPMEGPHQAMFINLQCKQWSVLSQVCNICRQMSCFWRLSNDKLYTDLCN